MKTMKRTLALVLALIMCAAMFTTVTMAEGDRGYTTGRIVIKSPNADVPMTNRTFALYRIFDAFADGINSDIVSYDWNHDADPTHFNADSYSADFAPADLNADGAACGPYYAFFFDPAENGGTARVTTTGNHLSAAMAYIQKSVATAASTAEFGLALNSYIAKHGIKADITQADLMDEHEYVYSNVEFGYYLIQETTSGADVVSALMLDTAAPRADVVLKATQPTVEKTVYQVGDTVVDADAASAQIGDRIIYKIEMVVPDVINSMLSRGFYWYHIKDEAGDGLTLDAEKDFVISLYRMVDVLDDDGNVVGTEKVCVKEKLVLNEDYLIMPESYEEALSIITNGTYVDGTPAEEGYQTICEQLVCYLFMDVDVMAMDPVERHNAAVGIMTNPDINMKENYGKFTNDGGGFVFRLTTSATNLFQAGDIIQIMVGATVNEKANKDNIYNNAILSYSKNPTVQTPDPDNIGKTGDDAKLYTYTLELTKVAKSADGTDSGTKLTGAQFEIYRAKDGKKLTFDKDQNGVYNVNPEGKGAETFVEVDADGKLTINGLGAETYNLKEIKAPNGYVIAENMLSFTITAGFNPDGSLNEEAFGASAGAADTTTGANIFIKYKKAEENFIEARVTNQIGKELPSTGGTGTMIFTLVGGLGGILMLSLLVLELKKRKQQ